MLYKSTTTKKNKPFSTIKIWALMFGIILSFTITQELAAKSGSETSLEEAAKTQQKNLAEGIKKNLIVPFGKAIGSKLQVETTVTSKLKKIKENDANNRLIVGIPFKVVTNTGKSTFFPEIESLQISCQFIYDAAENLNNSESMKKFLDCPEKFASWDDYISGKATKTRLKKKNQKRANEITLIDILSQSFAGNEAPSLLINTNPTSTTSDMTIGGENITGDGATRNGNGKTKKKSGGYLSGVSEFFKQNSGKQDKSPSGPQPDSGVVVSKKISVQPKKGGIGLKPKLTATFITGNAPHVRMQCTAYFSMSGDEKDGKFLSETIAALEDFAELFFDFSRKACIKAKLLKKSDLAKSGKTGKEEKPEKKTVKTESKQDTSVTKNTNNAPVTERGKRILEIQSKLTKLVPEYIPDNPTKSDSETFETIEGLLEGKSAGEIQEEAKILEENTINSSDGSGIGISRIFTPADESVAPGEVFEVRLKVVNKSNSPQKAAFTLYAIAPWTGKELAKSIQSAESGVNQISFKIKAPPAGEACKNFEFELLLEPMIGAGPVPKKVKIALRGSISDSDILNRVRKKIYEICSDSRLENDGITDKERDDIFNQWSKAVWKIAHEQAAFKKLFNSDPTAALEKVVGFVRPKAWQIVKGKAEQRDAKTAAETEYAQKLHKQIMYFHLETAACKRNAIIDYRIDPGYDLLDVLKDHIDYDEKTGEVTGDLDEARSAVTEANWELMEKTMSAADKYYLTAGDDGLPEINEQTADENFNGYKQTALESKSYLDGLQKLCDLFEEFKKNSDATLFDAGTAKKIAGSLKKVSKQIMNTQQVVGKTAKPLADAIADYQGMFSQIAKAGGKSKQNLNVSDLPNLLGNIAKSMKSFGARISSALEAYENAVRALPEAGKLAPVIKALKMSTKPLRKLVENSFSIGGSMAKGVIKFADDMAEIAVKGSGKSMGKLLDATGDMSKIVSGSTNKTANYLVDMAETAAETAKKSKSIVQKTGDTLDFIGVIMDADTYIKAGQSQTEAYSRAIVSTGIERAFGSKINPIGLINYGMVLGGQVAAKSESATAIIKGLTGVPPKQLNLSVPTKIIANTGVNVIMDYYNSKIEPKNRENKARFNQDKICELIILENKCLKMAKSTKDPAIKKDYMRKRQLFREEIRKLGGKTK